MDIASWDFWGWSLAGDSNGSQTVKGIWGVSPYLIPGCRSPLSVVSGSATPKDGQQTRSGYSH